MKTTEQESAYIDIDIMSTEEIMTCINQEDEKVASVVKRAIPQLNKLVDEVVRRMQDGARLFYVGAGTSGRLGILDASECPPTFGIPRGQITALIAGGDSAIRNAVERAEDDEQQAWEDLLQSGITTLDIVIGIAASGSTPYVVGAVSKAKELGLMTGCVVCNGDSLLAEISDYPVEVVTGPEFLTGSTRMKAGTAQKLVLNMISTATMIRLGKVKGNKMVDMQLTNKKLFERGVGMIIQHTGVEYSEAADLLNQYKNVREVIAHLNQI